MPRIHSIFLINFSMAVEAVGSVVLQKLTDLLIDDSIAFDNVIDQIEDIRIQLRRMRGFLITAELSKDPAATDWATGYLRVLFSAEDKIEDYVLSLSAHGRRRIGFLQRRGFTFFAAFYDYCGPGRLLRGELLSLAGEIKSLERKRPQQVVDASLRALNPNSDEEDTNTAIGRSRSDTIPVLEKRLDAIISLPSHRRRDFRVGSPSGSPHRGYHTHQKVTIPAYADQEGPILIGFTDDKKVLLKRLQEVIPGGGGGGGVVPVVGDPGSGKTTLIRTIFNHKEIKTYFSCRAWVHVRDESVTVSQLLDTLLQQVVKSMEGGIPNEEQLISRVQDLLKDKTYLVVFDHVSSVQMVECWDRLKSAFPDLDAGKSKVILLTRDQDIAGSISVQESCLHRLKNLCDDHSWQLLAKKAGLGQESGELDPWFKKEILEKCNGCPLDIVLLGGLLSTKGPGCDEWKWYLGQAGWSSTKILQMSYNDLPAHSKLCLLYMALFPNEVGITVRRLHRLWLAEGFFRLSPGMSEEETVEECFNDLVQRNLIKISKFRSDGSPRRCRLPRALREYLSGIAHDISLFYIHQYHKESVAEPPNLGVRRVIEYVDIKNFRRTFTSNALPQNENVRSYISFNFQRNDTPAIEVGRFISMIIGNKGYGVLRVLDLEGVYKPTLPETLKHLFHLRYLGLRWTFIDHLPKSVGDLPYLETLDLKRTHITSLPSSIWKLEHLRYLNLPGIRLDYTQKKGHSSLNALRSLVGMIVDDETSVEEELNKLSELRELGITCQLSSCDDLKRLISWIQKLSNLRSLYLKSKDKMGRPSKIHLQPLSESYNLSHVTLLGNIAQLPALNEFPPNLKILALSVSQLKDDPMAILSKLPSLSVLRLLADSYLGEKMNCPKDGFKNLRVLKLWMLKELVEWTVEEGGMPILKELFIRYCCKLEKLPSRLLNLDTLEELTLTAMPEAFVKEVNGEKQPHTTLILNNYKFTPLPWENDPELWRSDEVCNFDDLAN